MQKKEREGLKRRVAHVSLVDHGILLGLESSSVDREVTCRYEVVKYVISAPELDHQEDDRL